MTVPLGRAQFTSAQRSLGPVACTEFGSWLARYGLERQYPDVRWTRDVRYVDDGRIITTAAVLSGVVRLDAPVRGGHVADR